MIATNTLTHNELPYVKNLVRQLAGFADEIYICDDYSTDGTWEWLKDNEKKYNLKLFQRKFDWLPGEQRTFLLSKVPKDCWVMTIDADEIPTFAFRHCIRELLNSAPNPPDVDRIFIYVFNLVEDLSHYHEDIGVNLRIFWNSVKNNVHFISKPHDTIQGNWSPQDAGVIKGEQGVVHLKLLDNNKVKLGRKEYIEHGIYQKDHIGEVFESKKFLELPAHIGFDITTELINYLGLQGVLCGK